MGLGLRHDPSLDSYVSALHSIALEQHPQNLSAWSVVWLNSTAVRISWAYTYLGSGNETSNQSKITLYSESFVTTDFFGAKTASAYVGSVNSTYKLLTTTYGGEVPISGPLGIPHLRSRHIKTRRDRATSSGNSTSSHRLVA